MQQQTRRGYLFRKKIIFIDHGSLRERNPSPDDALFRDLSLTYVKNHPALSKGENCPDTHFKDGITNGAQWYIMKGKPVELAHRSNPIPKFFPQTLNPDIRLIRSLLGGMADFNYAFSNCMETTLELSCCKYPNSSQLAREWNDNWQSILAYMEQVIIPLRRFLKQNCIDKVSLSEMIVKSDDFICYHGS